MRASAILISALLAALLLMFGAQPAMAQTQGGTCNGPGAMPATLSLTPQSGPAGSTTELAGSVQLQPAVFQPGTAVQALWFETGLVLGDFEITIDEQLVAHFGGNIMIPAGAAAGPHQVAVMSAGDEDPACVAFTVVESVQQTAYPQTAAALPSTGESAYIPVIGLFFAGAGWLALTHRRRTA